MDDYFTDGDYSQPVVYAQHTNGDQNEWEQTETGSNAFQSSALYGTSGQSGSANQIVANIGSSSALQVDSEVTRKITQEEDRINEILRQKSAKQYEDKQARKTAGRQQLEAFFAQKQKELDERKLHNLEHEKNIVEKARELTSKAGWAKVFENVSLKQGENQSSKSTNRMRESIINKREDERTQK